MVRFKDFHNGDGVDYFVIVLNEEKISTIALLNEGRWVETGDKDWLQRVDAANPSVKLQRHVHIARSKHINSKSMQASWNEDGTKHDSKSFNSNVGSLNIVQSIAKKALNLPASIELEESKIEKEFKNQINEDVASNFIKLKLFTIKNT
jgi:hypothetical protein